MKGKEVMVKRLIDGALTTSACHGHNKNAKL